ncbi:polysaccharide deacetylase family protein [Romboutsia sp.]|uniref:polysaccharide deacetylase family protein n=1 Tax=Romboutsia sp. TaxID=1965302 RepID=UPI003F33D422
MKKILYSLSVCLFLFIGIYSYNLYEDKDKEVTNFNLDSINDYEDIIIKRGSDDEKIIALTFDDGPDEDYTPQILDILKKYDVKATFFVVGQKVGWNPELVKREFEEGHEIGNHTFTHINVCHRNYDEIYKEITKTQETIQKVIGKEPKIFRPPYRAINKEMCSIVKDKNMNVVLWSNLDPRDWSNPGVYYIANTIMTKATNGNIILLHDYNNVRRSTSQTIQALDSVIPKLKEKGYKFVTVSQLINHMDKHYPTQK